MKLRRSIALTALAGVMLLGGCSMGFNDPALLHPPKTTGREAEIQRLLDETAKNNYVLKYPKSGAFRSAIITQDINHDGKDEAVAFYSDGNSPVNVLIMYDNKGWKISKSFSTDFPEVDCVQFADYDTDGTDEILAGFVTDGGQNELRVFDLDAKTNDTTAIDFSAEYSGFTTGDYDRDGSAEIMLMKLQSTDSDAEAILVDFDGRKLYPLSVCKMDPTVTKLEKTTSGMISEDTTGVVADGITESGYNTQVLYYSATKAALVNFPLTTSKKPNPTSRSFSVLSEDIDDDGFIEVPVISPDNITAESEETAPVISWSKLSTKSNKLIEDIQCVGNYDFGYYFTLPEGFAGLTAATVSKDRRTLTICAAQDGELGEKLLTFRVIDVGENVPDDFSTIESYNQYTYTYKINNADYIYIDEEIIKENFALNDSGACLTEVLTMKKVLVCEDESAIRDFVVINLQRAGYDVVEADSGEAALKRYEENGGDFDVAILDVMLPGIDGFQVCKELRNKNGGLGIIMLSAKTQEMDKVTGLMLGADDYVTKPFSPSELLARVDSLHRRVSLAQANSENNFKEELHSGDFTLNLRNRALLKNGQTIELTQVEFQIMEYFFSNPGVTLDRTDILSHVWGDAYVGEEKIVDVNIRRLRMKVEDEPSNPKYIVTVWGLGYKWDTNQ